MYFATMTDTITLALDAMPLTLDHHWPGDLNARLIAEAVVFPLFKEPYQGTVPDAGSACSAISLDDGQRWQVTINETLRWSDGKPLVAADAVRAIRQALARQRSAVARLLTIDATGSQRDIAFVDACTFEIRLPRPLAFVRELLCLPQLAPRREHEGTNSEPVLGPYFVEGRDDASITLQRWSAPLAPGVPSHIVFRHIPCMDEALCVYDAGEIDVTPTTGLGSLHLAALRGRPDFLSRTITLFACLEFGHQVDAIARSARLRNALARVFNRSTIAQRVEGLAQPWWSHTAPWDGIHFIPPPEPISDRDRADIRHACPNGITVKYADFAPNDEIVREVCYQLQGALGIPVRSTALTFKQYVRAAITRDYSLLFTLTTANFPHPAALLSPWRSGGSVAVQIGLADAVLDQRISAAESYPDAPGQLALWRSVDDRWHELMPHIQLLQLNAQCLRAPHLRDFELTQGGLVRFERMFTASELQR